MSKWAINSFPLVLRLSDFFLLLLQTEYHLAQASLQLTVYLGLTLNTWSSQVLGLQVCSSIPSHYQFLSLTVDENWLECSKTLDLDMQYLCRRCLDRNPNYWAVSILYSAHTDAVTAFLQLVASLGKVSLTDHFPNPENRDSKLSAPETNFHSPSRRQETSLGRVRDCNAEWRGQCCMLNACLIDIRSEV